MKRGRVDIIVIYLSFNEGEVFPCSLPCFVNNSPVVFCHFWFQCGTLRPYLTHPHVKGATPDAASHRGSRSPGDGSCGRLPGPLRESVPVSTFPELLNRPDRPRQQKPGEHHPLRAGECGQNQPLPLLLRGALVPRADQRPSAHVSAPTDKGDPRSEG